MKPTLVTCYVNPDLDGVAGVIGYAEFLQKSGKNVVAAIIGEPHEEAQYVLDKFGIEYPRSIPNANDFDQIILVDASEINGLEGKIAPEKVIELIDHRSNHEADKFVNAKSQIELVGAAATVIAEKYIQSKIEISKESAILLFAAIISNTLNFKGSVSSNRDKAAVVWLNETAKLPENFWKELFLAKSDLTGPKLAHRIEHDFAWFNMADKKVSIAQIEIIGAKKLAEERAEEIVGVLDKLKAELNLDFIFLNAVDLSEEKNFFVTNDQETKKLLEKILGIKFSGNVAQRQGLIMRKQITPLLKKYLEKNNNNIY